MVTSMQLSLSTVETKPANPVDTPIVVAIINVD